ncbi:MAG: hypothetical protein NVSMB7_12750 [Chitinophagaceae bacterium]
MIPAQNYKILYQDCTKHSADKDILIVLLQQQLMQLSGERQTVKDVITDQQDLLDGQAAQINEQQIVIDHQ